jgi:hypothetical protein
VWKSLAECYGKKSCHHKMMAIGAFTRLPASGKVWT